MRVGWNGANAPNPVGYSEAGSTDKAAAVAAVSELDAAGNLGEERVIGTDSDVDAGFDAGAALAGDDGAAGDELTGKGLYAQPLRV